MDIVSCANQNIKISHGGKFDAKLFSHKKRAIASVGSQQMERNHQATEMYPVLFGYFLPLEDIKTRLVEYTELPGETGEIIFEMSKFCKLFVKIAFFSIPRIWSKFPGFFPSFHICYLRALVIFH